MTSSAETMLQRMSRAIYAKAEALGIEIDPEGCGDLTRATILALAGLEALRAPTDGLLDVVCWSAGWETRERVYGALIGLIAGGKV